MGYLQEFRTQVQNQDYAAFLQLWDEYCAGDSVAGDELVAVLQLVKDSSFKEPFGQYAETALSLWKQLGDSLESDDVLRLILDLQTRNSSELAELTYNWLKERHSTEKYFNEKIRLVGLRNRDQFQGAITNYNLLSHMDKGKFVFHTGGWGTGEIVDISLVREELVLEFEYVIGRKDMSFINAFKNLEALDSSSFLARRFGDADRLEAQAKKDPLFVIHLL